MKLEEKLVSYIAEARYEDMPDDVVDLAKTFCLNILGNIVGGSTTEMCEELVGETTAWGGRKDATILLYGDKVPAHNAAFVNSYFSRALESDDGIRPGVHIGSSIVPTALAASELAGGCSGKEFLTALIAGAEVTGRINSVSVYNGLCPTGSCGIFATSIAAAKILGLDVEQIWHAMGISFCRSGGSPQSNRDGALSVRMNQGFISQEGLMAAQLAKKGFTGAINFLEGELGFFPLFANNNYDPEVVGGDLGKRFEFHKTMFRKYPCCASNISSTEAALSLVTEHNDITPDNIDRVKVIMTPHSAHIVDSPLVMGKYPRVNAQFNVRYCVANALLRKSSRLDLFEEAAVRDPEIMKLVDSIDIVPDPALDLRDETAVDMEIITRQGKTYKKSIDFAGGFPENPLTADEHMERALSYFHYVKKPLGENNIERIISAVKNIEDLADIRDLIPLLLW